MKSNKILLVYGLLFVVVLSTISPVLADYTQPKIENKNGTIFLVTPYIIIRINAGRPDILFWAYNMSSSHRTMPVYRVGFFYIAELFGEDMVVDNRDEIGGKIYNLVSSSVEWTLHTENYTNELRAILTSSTLSNGATISFVYHIYLEEIVVTKELNDTRVIYRANGLKEIKFDIIVNNWTFSPNATGLLFLVKIHELSFRNRLRIGNRINNPEQNHRVNDTDNNFTNRTADPNNQGVVFVDSRDNPKAYFSWSPVADIYDLEDNYITSVNCTPTIISHGIETKSFRGRRFGVEYVNLLLTYPNYGDGLKLVHDPTVGIEPESLDISYSWIALITLPVVAFMIIVTRRKKIRT